MSQSSPSPGEPTGAAEDSPRGDPWHAFGYVVSGVALYGFLGWLADRWLGTTFLVALGIVAGATLGLYLTFSRFNAPRPARPAPQNQPEQPEHHTDPVEGPTKDSETD
jgi:ATP synthase protein I